MDHLDVRAILEDAAVEPGGLRRLEAGDAPDAAAVAGHLAGCAACTDELDRLRRAEPILRRTIAEAPAVELRERTLAYVRDLGRPRGAAAATEFARPESRAPVVPLVAGRRQSRMWTWAAAAAAVLVVAAFGAGFLLGGRPAGDNGSQDALAVVARAQAELLAAPDAVHVSLANGAGTAWGTLVAAPSTGKMVVTATGLEPPPAGREYRCWIETAGTRTRLGTMWLAGDVAWWAGPAELPASIPPGTTFGVSLADVGGTSVGEPVLLGTN